MNIKNTSRLRRAKKTRANIKVQESPRLTVFRSSRHFYAQVFDNLGSKVIVSASTAEKASISFSAVEAETITLDPRLSNTCA